MSAPQPERRAEPLPEPLPELLPELLNAAQVAALLGYSADWMYRSANRAKLTARGFPAPATDTRWRRVEVMAWLRGEAADMAREREALAETEARLKARAAQVAAHVASRA